MRPLTLEMSGFRSHEARTEISFEDRTFVAITGPTGAGKSSILDGISFALYGKTPRVKKGQKRLICSRGDAAHVRFRFVIEKDEYEITRVLRRSGAGEHLIIDCSSGERTPGEAQVTAKVEELLGLDFEAFCSSVLLAQGKFARFLEAGPTDQMKILKGVFRLDQIDRLRDAAKAQVAGIDLDLREIEGSRAMIPPNLADLLDAQRKALEQTRTRIDVLSGAAPREKALLEDARTTAGDLERAEADAARFAEALDSLVDGDDLADLVHRASKATARAGAAKAAVAAAEQERAKVTEEARTVEAEAGSIPDLVGLERDAAELRAVSVRLDDLEGEAARAVELVRDRRARVEAAVAAAEEAATAADGAREHVRVLERAHSAHALRAHLMAGEPCPVCEQEVGMVPTGTVPAELDGALAAEKDAEATLRRARKHAESESRALVVAEQDFKGLAKRIEEETTARVEVAARLERALGKCPDYGAELAARRRRLDTAYTRVKDAQAALDAARETATEADAAASTFADRMGDVRSTLVHAAGVLGERPPALKEPDRLLEFGARLLEAAAEKVAGAKDHVAKVRSAAQRAVRALAELRESVGVRGEDSVEGARSEAMATAAGLVTRIEELEKHAQKATELDAREKDKRTERALYHELADDFRDIHFVTFLLEDRRRLLSELGSVQFKQLTGRYRFDDEATFNVVDELDADKKRDVETLSGGELFLASLALALGLADAVAGHGGRLQCFFLDEGFGSLDPESLDAALDGIENIVRDDRLIGLVSHVPALAARVEDKIELEKGSDGMTVMRSGATIEVESEVGMMRAGNLKP